MRTNMMTFAVRFAITAGVAMFAIGTASAQCPNIGLPIGANPICQALAIKTITPVPQVQDPGDLNGNRNDQLNGNDQELGLDTAVVAVPTTFTSTGTGSFTAVASPIGTPCTQFLTPTTLSLTGTSALGTITTTLSAVAAQNSSIISNQAGSEFPATGNLYFNVSVSISSQPGTFTSSTPVHLQNTNLTSFNPHVNQTYTLVGSVDLKDANGVAKYRISNLSVTLN